MYVNSFTATVEVLTKFSNQPVPFASVFTTGANPRFLGETDANGRLTFSIDRNEEIIVTKLGDVI